MSGLSGWSYQADLLSKTFIFGSFREAISFIVRISFEAEAMNHHPEFVNRFSKVSVQLTTHDAGGVVTEKDFKLAQRIEDISWA